MAKVIARCSGVIVGSEYDDKWFDTYIQNGTITPSSRFNSTVETATDELEVHINSYGGDVFAAKSMIIAVKQWAARHPDAKLTYVVESIAMSAAANILAKAPENATVMAFDDSIVMFHSATTITWGGPGAHKDSAQLLDMINNDIIMTLLGRTSLDEKLVRQWFQDERMGWLNGHDCMECGLIGQICTEGAPELPPDKYEDKDTPADIAAYYKGQRDLLALFNSTPKGEKTMPKAEGNDDEILKKGAQQNGGEGEGEDKKDDAQQNGGEGEGEDKKDDAQQLADVKAENEALKQQVEDLKQQLAAQQEAVKKLTAGFRRDGRSTPGKPAQSFKELVASIDPNLPQAEWDKRYLQLKQEYPSLYQEYFKNTNTPKH